MNARRSWRLFAALNVGAVAAVCLFSLFGSLAARWPQMGSCPWHDYLGVYCVTCGATRATTALLCGQWGEALRCNAAVVCCFLALLWWDLRALGRLLRGHPHPFAVRPLFWWSLLGVLVGYALLRDVCLVGFGWDWIGDFI